MTTNILAVTRKHLLTALTCEFGTNKDLAKYEQQQTISGLSNEPSVLYFKLWVIME